MSVAHFVYKTVPYEHQIEAVHYLYDKKYFALLMEQGTGKSKVLIDIASNLFLEKKIDAVLLIAPNGVQDQWSTEQIPQHSPIPYTDLVWDHFTSPKKERELHEFITERSNTIKWFCINVEAFSRDAHLDVFRAFLKRNRTFVIVDESTRIKSPTAQRTINVIQGLSNVLKIGKRVTSIAPLSEYRAIATGTMVTNSPYDLWAPFEFLDHNYLKMDYYSFRNHYGIETRVSLPGSYRGYTRKITSKEINSVRTYIDAGKSVEEVARIMAISESSVRFLKDNRSVMAPYKNLDELKRAIAPISFIVRKADCLDLPPKIYEKIYVELSDEQKKAYKELSRDFITSYADTELSVLNKVSLLGRLSQITGGFFPVSEKEGEKTTAFTANPKLEALVEDLCECSDFPVIVLAFHVAEIKTIYTRLRKEYEGDRVEYICGEVPESERATIIEGFKHGDVKILVANARTIGSGYNLQISHVQYFFSNSYSMEEREQVEDRIHRDGQKSSSVLYKDIIAKNTIDEKVLSVLKAKRDLLDYMRGKTIHEFLGEL